MAYSTYQALTKNNSPRIAARQTPDTKTLAGSQESCACGTLHAGFVWIPEIQHGVNTLYGPACFGLCNAH